MKRCLRCRQWLPLTAFRVSHTERDGDVALPRCRPCERIHRQERYPLGAGAAYARQYYQQHRAEHLRRLYAYRDRFPERRRAEQMVTKAVRCGRLIPAPCEQCGGTPTEAHHDDYSKPLDVRWLCRLCHAGHHHPLALATDW